MARTARTVPANVDDLDNIADEELPTNGAAPDPRLVAKLEESNEVRKATGTGKGMSFIVADEETAKLRERELRKAGAPEYANCGVSVKLLPVNDDNGEPTGRIKVWFKARQRRGEGTAATGEE